MTSTSSPRAIADAMAVALYGWTASEARTLNVCVRCRRTVGEFDGWEPRDRLEWAFFSGLCPVCWEALMPPEEDCGA